MLATTVNERLADRDEIKALFNIGTNQDPRYVTEACKNDPSSINFD